MEKAAETAATEQQDGIEDASPGTPTVKVVTLDAIYELLARQKQDGVARDAHIDTLGAKIDALRAEGDKRGALQESGMAKLESNLDATRNEVKSLGTRMQAAEIEIAALKDGGGEVRRQVDQAKQEQTAAIEGAISHVKRIDDGFTKVSSEVDTVKNSIQEVKSTLESATTKLEDIDRNDEKQNKELAKNARFNKALSDVLGVDYDAVAADPNASGQHLAMEARAAAVPKATLPTVARDNKIGALVGLITLGTLVAQIILKSCH